MNNELRTNKYKPNQSRFIVSLPALGAVEGPDLNLVEGTAVEVSNLSQNQNNGFARAKILTNTNKNANFKKCMVFRLFIERNLFGR
jgi:hypothetical protein